MKKKILLLHGALGSKIQMQPLAAELQDHFEIHSIDFTGHGSKAGKNVEMRMENFSQEIIAYIISRSNEPMHIFGYSMGGYAALVAAISRPELFLSISTLGTKFNWTLETASHEMKFLDSEKIETKVPQFAKMLSDLHAPTDWKLVVEQTKDMMRHLGNQPIPDASQLSKKVKIQILVGELDQTAGVEPSSDYAKRSDVNFHLIPETPHPLDKVDLKVVSNYILGLAIGQIAY